MKYSEAEEQIKRLSDKYSIEMNGKDFCVVYDGEFRVAYVDGINKYGLHYCGILLNIPANDELFMILAQLAKTPLDKRAEEKKYLVKALGMYLNIETNNNHPSMNTRDDCLEFKTNFTLNEIERLKQREDIALDWNKVALEEAEQRTC